MTSLRREIGLWRGTALNMIEMVGIGPFVTIPFILTAMGGGRSMLAWIIGGLLAMCDGLVTAELASQFPASGGSYVFLRESYGRFGRLVSFVFLFQMLITAPLSIASGCIGFANYLHFIAPSFPLPLKIVSAELALLTTFILLRRIDSIGRFSIILWVSVMSTLAIVIALGIPHLSLSVFEFWRAPRLDGNVGFAGLGVALIFAVYDYLGYYNIANIGDEVKNPTRTVPRVIIISILAICAIYILMNACLISVLPMRQAMTSKSVVADYLTILAGPTIARVVTVLVLITAFASVFSVMLGYSRVIYAASRDGNFFSFFATLHSRDAYPIYAVAALGGVATLFCFLDLQTVVKAILSIRAIVPFMAQIVGALLLRFRKDGRTIPFKMWLFPLPAVVALFFWEVIIFSPEKGLQLRGISVLVIGVLLFFLRSQIVSRQRLSDNRV